MEPHDCVPRYVLTTTRMHSVVSQASDVMFFAILLKEQFHLHKRPRLASNCTPKQCAFQGLQTGHFIISQVIHPNKPNLGLSAEVQIFPMPGPARMTLCDLHKMLGTTATLLLATACLLQLHC